MQSCVVSEDSCDDSYGNKEEYSYYDGLCNSYCSYVESTTVMCSSVEYVMDRVCSPVTGKVGTSGGTGFREPAQRGPLQTELEVNWRNLCG